MKLKKFKNQKFSFMAIVAFMAILLIMTGCKDKTTVGEKTGGPGYVDSTYYDISGVVVDDAEEPITDVFIDIIDYVMVVEGAEEPFVATVRTDGNGEFALRIRGDNAVRQVTLRFTFQNNITYTQDVLVKANQEVELGAVTLTIMSQKYIEDSTIENTLFDNVRENASVTIGPNTLVYSDDGTPFTTVLPEVEEGEDEPDPVTATVAIGYADTASDPGLFPGELYSMDGGSLKLFSTYGLLEIKITTDNGNVKLDLADGQTASISIPVGEVVNVNSSDFPTTVDMWYYDEDMAEWVLEKENGFTFNAETRSFVGTVSHFSTYNAGYTFETKYVNALVLDDRGMMCPSDEYNENEECTVEEEPYLVGLPGSTIKILQKHFHPLVSGRRNILQVTVE